MAYTMGMEATRSSPSAEPIGYCAIIMPDIDQYQAFFIIDTPSVRANALQMGISAMVAMGPAGVFGAMQAVFAEGMLTGNESQVAGATLSLHNMSKNKYFYVVASKDPQGTRSQFFELAASSIDEARDMINALPEVLAIKKRLMLALGRHVFMGEHQ